MILGDGVAHVWRVQPLQIKQWEWFREILHELQESHVGEQAPKLFPVLTRSGQTQAVNKEHDAGQSSC